MSELRIVENGIEYESAELLCVRCFNRWVGTYESKVALKDLECPNCGHAGLIVKTGQTLYIDNTVHQEPEDASEEPEDIPEEGEPNE